MLATVVISIRIKFHNAITIQRICTSIKTYSTSSGSSSDSSSGSDSDSDTKSTSKIQTNEWVNKTPNEFRKTANTMNIPVSTMLKKLNKTKMPNVAIPSRETIKKKMPFIKTNLSYKAQLTKAATDVANVFGGNKQETKWTLLHKSADVQKTKTKQDNAYSPKQVNRLLLKNQTDNETNEVHNMPSISVSAKLMSESRQNKMNRDAITTEKHNFQNKNRISKQNTKSIPITQDIVSHVTSGVMFTNINQSIKSVPELSTWKFLHQRELNLISNQPPKNIFQEMIQWTESGKLWKFPIDNEYGMEEESNVHFTEHVFLERHLKDWCPKRGPIRHYMELVCIGLSKNPYMSVDEKIGHITWYKDYFNEKKELLIELGISDNMPNNEEEIKA